MHDRLPQFDDPEMEYQPTQPQLSVRIDRRRAEDLGVPVEGIANTLRAMIRERMSAGLQRARKPGKRLGRPRVPYTTERAIRAARAQG